MISSLFFKKIFFLLMLSSTIFALQGLISCRHWRVTELTPTRSVIVPFGKEAHELKVHHTEKGIFHTPENIAVYDEFLYVVDSFGAKILVINTEKGSIEKIYQNKNAVTTSPSVPTTQNKKDANTKSNVDKKTPADTDTALTPLIPPQKIQSEKKEGLQRLVVKPNEKILQFDIPLVQPGKIAINRQGMILVQNRLPQIAKPQPKKAEEPYLPEMAPSYLLVLSVDGRMYGRLHADEAQKSAYKQIMGIHAAKDDSFAVISRNSPEEWIVQRFSAQSHANHIQENLRLMINPKFIRDNYKSDDKETHRIVIEQILPRFDEKKYLISVAYYKEERFKFRRILILNEKSPNSLDLFTEFLEPLNELYGALENNQSYFWSTSGLDQITLKIYNSSGDLTAKKGLTLFGKQEAWREFVPQHDGSIITFYASRVAMEFIFWK